METLLALVVLLLALAIVAVHVIVSARSWGQRNTRSDLLRLAGVALITYVVWYLAAILVGLLIGLYSPGASGPALGMYYSTFGLPIYPCDALPPLESFLGGFICDLP